MEKTKVLHIVGALNLGGAETMIMNIFRNIDRSRFQFDFYLSGNSGGFYEEEVLQLGGRIFNVGRRKKHPVNYCTELFKLIRKEKYDAVQIHATDAMDGLPAFISWLAGSKKICLFSHNTRGQSMQSQKIMRAMFMPFVTHPQACSDMAAEWMFGKRANEAEIIPLPINCDLCVYDQEFREKERLRLGLTDKKIVGHIGRFQTQKNHDQLIDIFAELMRKDPEYRLILIGVGDLEESIANQRTLLEAYAADHPELCIVDEFVDDGYSGSNFERPAFQNLFRELEQGTINCILVKDLSRFGRNYIEVGRYLERIFPVMRVRLIAVTDSYDSQSAWKTSDSIMVPMRNLLNDAYCRDISVKIKSQLAVKRKRGDFVGSFATYGYQKDPSNHTKLIVDELAAETVQDIFRWKISGMSNQGIADRLNVGKVPSPAARKLQSGAKLSLHFRKSDEPPWSAKAVDRILHNEVYIGKLVQGKTRRLDYRSKKKMNVPMRDWVIVDNTHGAIIPAEQFELVQRILETETRRPNDAETVALFAGFLYCGDCGSRLVRRSASYKGKRYIYYQCSGSKQNKGSCTIHNLRDENLYNIVRNALQMQIQIVMEEAEFVESIRQAQQEPYRVRRIERQIRQLTAEKAHTQGIKEKLYGDYAEEILTREDFLNYNELYSKRIEEYDRKITELEAERQNLQTAPNAYPFLDAYRKYRKLEEITRPMVVELIEKIEVYEGNRVEITFRFQDEIADLLEELHQKQMGQHEVSA
jgi:site-specific DNA recombinase